MKAWNQLIAPSTRRRRACVVAAVILAWAALLAGGRQVVISQALAYNRTDSLPRGFYSHRPLIRPPRRGDLVVSLPPPDIHRMALERGYLAPEEFLFKWVLAVPGDQVCVTDDQFMAAGIVIGPVLHSDRSGRPLPQHRFCGVVPPGLYYLGTRHPTSFDSRYVGPVPLTALRARLEARWTF